MKTDHREIHLCQAHPRFCFRRFRHRKIHDRLQEPDEAILRAPFPVYAKHGALDTSRVLWFPRGVLGSGGYADPPWTITFIKPLPSGSVTSTSHYTAAKDLRMSTYDLIRDFLLIGSHPTTVLSLLRKEYRKPCIFFLELIRRVYPSTIPPSVQAEKYAMGTGLTTTTTNE